MTALLSTENLTAFHGDFQALFGIDFEIHAGEIVAIVGANGAGKTTFLRALTGMVRTSGSTIRFDGREIAGLPAHRILKAGIAMVPEGRRLFPSLSVEENLLIGAYGRREANWSLEGIFELFPMLAPRRAQPATSLSGGEQQMVAIGRALMSDPKLLLCDEISLGLAPIIIRDIYQAVPKIRDHGATLVIVEQDISRALAAADRVYCLQEGRVSLCGRPQALNREQIAAAYFGPAGQAA